MKGHQSHLLVICSGLVNNIDVHMYLCIVQEPKGFIKCLLSEFVIY